jgi:hypothetical protein
LPGIGCTRCQAGWAGCSILTAARNQRIAGYETLRRRHCEGSAQAWHDDRTSRDPAGARSIGNQINGHSTIADTNRVLAVPGRESQTMRGCKVRPARPVCSRGGRPIRASRVPPSAGKKGQRGGIATPSPSLGLPFSLGSASHGAKTTKLEERDIALRGKAPRIKKI